MGLLDGGLKAIFGTAFAPIFLAGLIHVPTRAEDGGGSVTLTFTGDAGQADATACKAIVVALTEAQREDAASQDEVSIIVLMKDVPFLITTDHEITAKTPGSTVGVRYRISSPVLFDPAGATATFRGQPK